MTTVIAALAGANTINQMMYNVNQIRTGITFSSNTAIRVPFGTTAQRPTAVSGAFRYNTQLAQFEGYTAEGWGSIGGGGLGAFKLIAGTYTANSGDRLAVSTTAAGRTITLPGSPAAEDIVEFIDKDASFATNNLTISRNGSTIEGSSANLVADISSTNFFMQYTGSTWEVFGIGSGETTVGADLTGTTSTATFSAAGLAKIALANTNAALATKATVAQAALANTNAAIATKSSLAQLANTNTFTVRTTGAAQTMQPSLVVANTFVAQHGMPMRTTGGNTVTLALADNGKLLLCTNTSSAMNIRIPNNSSVAFPVGAEISLVNVLTHASANTLGFVNTAGVILNSKEAANTVADRFTSATLKKTATNTWLLIGNLA
jgi:hypothetical protein|tara:strand:+ start:42 stop:1169 length:1128 start_codon:yes stop_codon:yes gene_type:complete